MSDGNETTNASHTDIREPKTVCYIPYIPHMVVVLWFKYGEFTNPDLLDGELKVYLDVQDARFWYKLPSHIKWVEDGMLIS